MIFIGPTWRHAMLASLVSSATPSPPFSPPVCARLIWQATPSTLGSSKPSTTILSFGPRRRNLVLTEPVAPRSGRSKIHNPISADMAGNPFDFGVVEAVDHDFIVRPEEAESSADRTGRAAFGPVEDPQSEENHDQQGTSPKDDAHFPHEASSAGFER